MAYVLGLDVSTTATKALLLDASGAVVAVAATEYPYETPRPLWSEQDPALWWDGAGRSMRAVLAESGVAPEAVAAVGLTGQMHGLVLLDEAGEVLRPAILWNDGRTAAECDEIRRRLGKERLVRITGNDALTGFTAPKILWVRTHEPNIFARARHVLLPKDYLRFCLTGDYATDRAGAAGTLLFDLEARDWSEEVCAALDIPRGWLPPTHEGPEITGVVSVAAAAATGLRAGTPVVAGGGDQAAGAVGVGAVREGVVSLALGTSGVVFATTDGARYEPEGRLHAFCHAVPGRWHFMGVMLSAAGSLRWYRDTLAPLVAYDDLLAEAASTPPGSDGLLFLPYLTGERTPHPDPIARGAFGLREGFDLMRQSGTAAVEEVRVSGGGARGARWRQIIADVLHTPLVTVNATEGAAFGAALLAGVGAGLWADVDAACQATIRVTGRTEPTDPAAYDAAYGTYRTLYPALKPTFDALATA